MTTNPDPGAATLDAVLLLLQAGSLTTEDLMRHAEGGASATTGPTVADYVRESRIVGAGLRGCQGIWWLVRDGGAAR